MAEGRRDTLVRSMLAALFAAFGAYAFGFALDLLFGGLAHVYRVTDPVPIVLWALMSVAGIALAVGLRPDGRAIWIPVAAMAAFSITSAARGHFPHAWLVAAGLVMQAVLVWLSVRPAKGVRTPGGA